MSGFNLPNLSLLPAPAALEAWTFDAILAARFATFLTYWQAAVAADPTLPTYTVQTLTSTPGSMLQMTDTYREGLVRQRINEAVLATSLAFAVGSDLDVVAANYATTRVAGETDASLRQRAQLAWEYLSRGGSYGGYAYEARTSAPVDIAQAVVYGHETPGVALGEVRIVLLGAGATGAVPLTALAAAKAAINTRATRKVNDWINIVPATLIQYQISATLILAPGADGPTVQAAQWARAQAYASACQSIGAAVDLGGVMAAVGYNAQGLVQGVTLRQPFSGAVNLSSPPQIAGSPFEAPICSSVNLDWVNP